MNNINIEAERQLRSAIVDLGGNLLPIGHDILNLPFEACLQESRYYHNDEHRAQVSAQISDSLAQRLGGEDLITTANALKCLIGNYHDIVYLQIDGGFPPNCKNIILQYINKNSGEFFIKENIAIFNNNNIWALLDIFDLEPGDRLFFKKSDDDNNSQNICGNEFLSALVAVHELHAAGIPNKNIIRVVFGIAAIIPFQGQDYFDKLCARLDILHTKLNEHEIKLIKIIAAETANCSIGNFLYSSFECFISELWSIMPEQNANLRDLHFSTYDYCKSLIDMKDFINNIVDIKGIFYGIYDYPSPQEIDIMQKGVESNISAGLLYIRTKIATMGILDAIGNLISSDKIWDSMMLNLKIDVSKPDREFTKKEEIVSKALHELDNNASTIYNKSPIALFLFNNLDEDVIVKLANMTEAELQIKGEHHYVEYLKIAMQHIGEDNLEIIINALADFAAEHSDDTKKAEKIKAIPNILKFI